MQDAERNPSSLCEVESRGTFASPIPSDFTIPLSPAGQILEIHILSTWGDPHYVGLSAIEIFDTKGMQICIKDPQKQVTAVPESINVLDEYDSDPRLPENLVDGTCALQLLHLLTMLPRFSEIKNTSFQGIYIGFYPLHRVE